MKHMSGSKRRGLISSLSLVHEQVTLEHKEFELDIKEYVGLLCKMYIKMDLYDLEYISMRTFEDLLKGFR